jgi:SEC-C motif
MTKIGGVHIWVLVLRLWGDKIPLLIRTSVNVMLSGYEARMNEPSPGVEIFRVLRAAGCDTKNEHDLQMGLIAYNTALLVSDRRDTHKKSGPPSEKSHTGRNDPCPCRSGKKYKKCCLNKDQAISADAYPRSPLEFGPESLPRLWDERAVANDCAILGEIMDRDPAFAKMCFSNEKVTAFIDVVVKDDPSFLKGDKDVLDRKVDDLAARYVRESGEGNVAKGMKESVLAAIPRAQSKDEMRALATGLCLALMDDSSIEADTPVEAGASLLNVILFRRALFDAIESAAVFGKIFDRLGGDPEEVRRLIAQNDPSVREIIESCMESLSPSDKATLQTTFEKNREELWNTIASGEFPVPMPFATHLALFVRFSFLARSERSSPEALSGMIKAFSSELIEEDYVLYSQMLERWLKDCKNRSADVAKAVELMLGFCAIRSIEESVPNLMVNSARQGLFIPFVEEEQLFIDQCLESCDDPDLLAKYGAWLTSQGFPGLANRLLASYQDYASTKSPELARVQKFSVG